VEAYAYPGATDRLDVASRMRRTIYETLWLAGLALFGTFTVLYATARWGIGLSPDSTTYIRVARSLFHKSGFRDMAGIADGFPPLFPMVLAAVAKLGTGVVSGARWLNAILFGADILLIGLVIRRHTDSLYAGLFGSLLALSAVGLLEIHFMAWSEPLFLFFVILELLLLAAFLDHPTESRLFYLSAAAGALAFLDRYPGAALVIAGTMGILSFDDAPAGTRIRHALVFGLLGGLPTVTWLLWTVRATGGVGGRHAFYFHSMPHAALQSGLDTVRAWLDPGGLHQAIVRHPLAVLALGIATIGGAGVYRRVRPPTIRYLRPHPQRKMLNRLPAVTIIFIVTYAAFLMFAFSFIQLAELNARFLSPIYVSGLILTVGAVSTVVRLTRAAPFLRGAIIGMCVVLAISYALAAANWVAYVRNEGLGYAAKTWQQSPIIERVKALPRAIAIYTNGPDAIYIFTGRVVKPLPAKVSDSTGLTNNNYVSEMTIMGQRVQAKEAVLVYLSALPRSEFPTERELREALPLRLIERVSDGSIYAW
jgi:hypothetical protein